MRKKKLLALCLAAGMAMSSVLPAYASENIPVAAESETDEISESDEMTEIALDGSSEVYESEIEIEKNGVKLKAANVLTLTSEPYAKVNYAYSESAEEKTIRYVSSLADNEYYYADYWGEWTEDKDEYDNYEKASCISMALSYMGIDLEPQDILSENDTWFVDIEKNWGDTYSFESSLDHAMDRYINGNGKYSPPVMEIIVEDEYGNGIDASMVIVGQKSEKEYQVLNPEDDSLWDVVIDGKYVSYTKDGKTIIGWDLGPVMQYGTETTEVVIEDEVLRGAVKRELNLTDDEPVTLDQISKMSHLVIDGNVQTLNGLEYADSLSYLTIRDGSINDLSLLNNNKELQYIYLYDNQTEDVSFLENSLECEIYLHGEGKTIENAFRKYIAYNPMTVLKNAGSVEMEEISSIPNLHIAGIDYESGNEAVVDIDRREYDGTYLDIKNQTGSSIIKARVGSAEKQFAVTVMDAPEEILEEEQMEALPEITGNSDTILYNKKLWVVSEGGVYNLSGDIKVKTFVERILNIDYKEIYKEISEIALLDENNTLYYYPYEENGTGYGEAVVIGKVRELCPHGYIDENGTYHIWSHVYVSGTESHPKEIQTVDNVKTVIKGMDLGKNITDGAIILEDGTSISYYLATFQNHYGEYPRYNFVVDKDFDDYVLDDTHCLWKAEERLDDQTEISFVQWDDNVSDLTESFYLKKGNCYNVEDKTLVKKNVEGLVRTSREEYLVCNSDLYQAEQNSDGEWEFTLYAKDYEKMVGDLVLTNDGELWKNGTDSESSYKIMTSVKDVHYDIVNGSSSSYGVCILRTDGTVWRWTGGMPELVLEPEESIIDSPTDMRFNDVHEGDWYYDSVSYVNTNRLMTGLNTTTFGPGEALSRAQFAVILHRMNGTPEVAYTAKFPDVADNTWYTDAVLWANSTGVVNGYSDTGKFGPGDNITREQMALMMYRYASYMGYDTSVKADFGKFKDAACVSTFAAEAMKWAVGNGIITGKNNGTMIDPQGNAARAECATIIMRFVEKYKN